MSLSSAGMSAPRQCALSIPVAAEVPGTQQALRNYTANPCDGYTVAV